MFTFSLCLLQELRCEWAVKYIHWSDRKDQNADIQDMGHNPQSLVSKSCASNHPGNITAVWIMFTGYVFSSESLSINFYWQISLLFIDLEVGNIEFERD